MVLAYFCTRRSVFLAYSDCKHADGMFVIVDCKTLLELLPSDSSDAASIRRTLVSLTPRVEAAQKQETAEMLGKLKGIGNSLLGKH